MNPEQESGETSLSQESKELKTQFETFDTKHTTLQQIDDFISLLKSKIDIDYRHEIYNYCKNHEHYKKLIGFAKIIKNRLEKKDVQLCIEGDTGCGKSTLTLVIYGLLCHIRDIKFNLEKNVIYKPTENELSKSLESLFNDILWVDESIKSLNKMKFYNKDVIASNENVQTERFRHNVVIYCIPNFYELVKSFRDSNIKMRLWCIGTEPVSAAVLWIKEKHPMLVNKYGAWHDDEIAAAAKQFKINPLSNTTDYLAFEQNKNPIYVDDYQWPDLANIEKFTRIHLLYEAYKLRSRIYEIENVEQEPEKMTAVKYKQKMTVVGIMKQDILDGQKVFEHWWNKYHKFMPMNKVSLHRYWQEAWTQLNQDKLTSTDILSINNTIPNPAQINA